MITKQDFSKKQIVFIMFNDGEKIAFKNDNLIVKTDDDKIKFQCTCYRLFLVFAVGNCSVTSVLIQKARKFGFFIAMMTQNFRVYSMIGAEKDGNTMLKRKQYSYDDLAIAKHIIANKMENQLRLLQNVRNKSDAVKESIDNIKKYIASLPSVCTLNELMAFEGLTSKIYFKNHFNNILWTSRKPRLKNDVINSVLDIGYTILFSFIECILLSFGFDTFCGVMHREFYMRKSLVCDLVEPFRPLIDDCIKKGINLKQVKEDDFLLINGQYRLKWEYNTKYVKILMAPLIDYKDDIFEYILFYYRAFMKSLTAEEFPTFYL